MTRLIIAVLMAWLALSAPSGASAACLVDADCSDGNVCTGTEHCVGGTCTPGQGLNCNDNNPCTIDSCDSLVGCQHGPVVDGAGCSDGNFCNGAETCKSGVCTAGQQIANGASCDDGSKCTTADACQNGTCVGGPARPDGSQCSDGNGCNGLELCFGGVCTPGQPAANGAPCGDGNPCNGDETCQAGVCTPGTPKPDGALCNDAFLCNGTETCKGQLCTAGTPPANGTSCDDATVCNGHETCQSQICVAGQGLHCDDGNPCTVDSCDAVLGCRHVARADGFSCADHDDCNGQETCQSGICTPGIQAPNGIPCSDGNPCNGVEVCQQGQCSPGSPLPDGTACTDPNVCNGEEFCQAGQCVSINAPNCDDNNPCTMDICNPGLGCLHNPRPNGSSCDDNDVCNGVELCQNGFCGPATPLFCEDTNPQTVNGCDPVRGCTIDRTVAGGLLNVRQSGLDRWAIKAKTGDIFAFAPGLLGNGTAADPVLHGATARVVSTNAAGPFDGRYDLAASRWSYIGNPGDNKGYRYRDRSPNAPIRVVQIKAFRPWKITGRGTTVGPKLAVDPRPVAVQLTLGNERFCMSFGGDVSFDPMHKYRAENAPAPASCTP
jgi:hypothetical protein